MLADLPTAPWFRRVLVAGLILGILLLTFSVLQPFIVPLIWGAILAYVSWPRISGCCSWTRGRVTGLASLVTTLLVTLASSCRWSGWSCCCASRRWPPMLRCRLFWPRIRRCRQPCAICRGSVMVAGNAAADVGGSDGASSAVRVVDGRVLARDDAADRRRRAQCREAVFRRAVDVLSVARRAARSCARPARFSKVFSDRRCATISMPLARRRKQSCMR